MFPATRRLSVLTQLDIAIGMTWQVSDLDRLVSSCSALQELALSCSPGLQLTALLRLTVLSQLCLTRVRHTSTVESLAELAGLQGLHRLVIAQPCSLPDDDDVLPLTALTQLTYLALTNSADAFSAAMQQQLFRLRREDSRDYGSCYIISNTVSALRWLGCCQQAGFV